MTEESNPVFRKLGRLNGFGARYLGGGFAFLFRPLPSNNRPEECRLFDLNELLKFIELYLGFEFPYCMVPFP